MSEVRMPRNQGERTTYGELREGLNFKRQYSDATMTELAEVSGLSMIFWYNLKRGKASVHVRSLLGSRFNEAIEILNRG